MFRYQALASSFGDTTWACHGKCGDFTKWRLVPECLGGIPPEHAPPSWGRQEEWLESIRKQRRLEQGGNNNTANKQMQVPLQRYDRKKLVLSIILSVVVAWYAAWSV